MSSLEALESVSWLRLPSATNFSFIGLTKYTYFIIISDDFDI